MQRVQEQILYSPSELINFMGSPFASWMDRRALDDGSLREKMDPEDRLMKTLQGRGYAHEAAYIQKLKADGLVVEEVARSILYRTMLYIRRASLGLFLLFPMML